MSPGWAAMARAKAKELERQQEHETSQIATPLWRDLQEVRQRGPVARHDAFALLQAPAGSESYSGANLMTLTTSGSQP